MKGNEVINFSFLTERNYKISWLSLRTKKKQVSKSLFCFFKEFYEYNSFKLRIQVHLVWEREKNKSITYIQTLKAENINDVWMRTMFLLSSSFLPQKMCGVVYKLVVVGIKNYLLHKVRPLLFYWVCVWDLPIFKVLLLFL